MGVAVPILVSKQELPILIILREKESLMVQKYIYKWRKNYQDCTVNPHCIFDYRIIIENIKVYLSIKYILF